MRIPRKDNKGFTLIELLVVISIIGMLSSVILVSLSSARAKGVVGAGTQFEDHLYHAFGADALGVWNFDEGSNSTARDISGNSTDIYVLPSVWATPAQAFRGKSALLFNGTDGYASLSGLKKFNTTKGSISFWIKTASFAGNAEKPILCEDTGYSSHSFCIFNSDITGTKFLEYDCTDFGPNSKVYSNIPTSSVVNKWTQVTISWNFPNIKFYINGTMAYESNAYIASVNTVSNFAIGSDDNGTFMAGTLDELRIYSQSLQTAEVERIYAEEAPEHGLAVAK